VRLIELPRRSFLVRYLTLFGGEAFSKLCVLAAFGHLARVLDPSQYGIIELALAVTVFFVLGVESGMGLYGARVVAADHERIPRLVPEVMVLRAALGVPAFLLILAVAAGYQASGLGILAINGIAVLLTPFLTQWVFQGLRQMQWVALGTAVRSLTFLAIVWLFVRPGSDIRLAAVAEVAGIGALALVNTALLRRLHIHLDWAGLWARVRRLFGDVWYMGLSDFTWACQWYAPGIVAGWMSLSSTEQVAWIGASLRIVMALHTFVWLYFFNMLPNLANDLSVGIDEWRRLVSRSLNSSMWPACLIAVGGTLFAPVLLPAIYGDSYTAAVRPFQIIIWMIPVAWFSGHFRFSLIAAGQQRWEFAASAATAVTTVILALVLVRKGGAIGAATAMLSGAIVNTMLSYGAMAREIATVPLTSSLRPALIAITISLAAGFAVAAVAGHLAGTIAGCLLYGAAAMRHENDLAKAVQAWMGRRA
jgi:O-antigen/teichoic acid export membrane protein